MLHYLDLTLFVFSVIVTTYLVLHRTGVVMDAAYRYWIQLGQDWAESKGKFIFSLSISVLLFSLFPMWIGFNIVSGIILALIYRRLISV